MKNKFHLVLIGSMTKDKIIIGKEKEWYAPGGGVYYGAFPPAMMDLKVAVITKLDKKDSHLLDEFKEEGIGVFPSWSEETTQMENVYPDAKNPDKRISKCIVPPTLFTLQDIPADIEAKIFHVTTLLKSEIPIGIIKEVSKKGILLLDVQGFMRNLEGKRKEVWEDKDEVLPLADILKLDRTEAEMLTGEKDPKKALRILALSGPKEILLTHREGVLVYAERKFFSTPFTTAWPVNKQTIEGRTGRGDTAIGDYDGQRILEKSPRDACYHAAAICSLKMRNKGPYKGV